MKKWTKQLLEESGYEIENAQIESVRLTMADHGVLTSDLVLTITSSYTQDGGRNCRPLQRRSDTWQHPRSVVVADRR